MAFDLLCRWLEAMGGSVKVSRLPKDVRGSHKGKRIYINRNLTIEERTQALAHEIAHIILGHITTYPGDQKYNRQERAATYLGWMLLEAINQGVTSLADMLQYLAEFRTSILRTPDAPKAIGEESGIVLQLVRMGLPR